MTRHKPLSRTSCSPRPAFLQAKPKEWLERIQGIRPPAGLCLGSLAVSWLAALGCQPQPTFGTVSGTVLSSENQPLDGLRVTYLPDPNRKTIGSHSSGITDASGRYTLTYRGAPGRSGSVVGWHKVVIEDYAIENSRQRRRSTPIRVPPRYRLASTTPLEVQIHAGEQTVDLQIEE